LKVFKSGLADVPYCLLWCQLHHRLEDSSDSDDERKKISEEFNSSYTEVPSPDSEEDPLDSFMAQIEVIINCDKVVSDNLLEMFFLQEPENIYLKQ